MIKIPKTIKNEIVFQDKDIWYVLSYLLFNVSEKNTKQIHNKKTIFIKKGEIFVTERDLAKKLNMSQSKIHRILKLLKNEKYIESSCESKTIKNKSIITVNCDYYEDNSESSMNQARIKHESKCESKTIKNSEVNTDTYSEETPFDESNMNQVVNQIQKERKEERKKEAKKERRKESKRKKETFSYEKSKKLPPESDNLLFFSQEEKSFSRNPLGREWKSSKRENVIEVYYSVFLTPREKQETEEFFSEYPGKLNQALELYAAYKENVQRGRNYVNDFRAFWTWPVERVLGFKITITEMRTILQERKLEAAQKNKEKK